MYPPFIFEKNDEFNGVDVSDDVTTTMAIWRVNDKIF